MGERRIFCRARSIAVAALVAWAALAAPAPAQSPDLAAAYRGFQTDYAAGNYIAARRSALRALDLGEKELGADHPNIALLLGELGLVARQLGRYREAEAVLQQALELQEQVLPANDANRVTILKNFANLRIDLGQFDEAEKLITRAIAIAEAALGPTHPGVATLLGNLGHVSRALGRYQEAETALEQAIELQDQMLPASHADRVPILTDLANLRIDLGQFDDAEKLIVRAIAIAEAALGPTHPSVAAAQSTLGNIYLEQGRLSEAETLHKRALALRERAFGAEHVAVALSLYNLANIYDTQGRSAEAETLYQRALAMREKLLGPEHPSVADILQNLANIYSTRPPLRYDDAEAAYQRAVAIYRAIGNPNDPKLAVTLKNLAGLLGLRRRYDEARRLYDQSLAITERVVGPDHVDFAYTLEQIATMEALRDRNEDALDLHRRALPILQRHYPPDHPQIATSYYNTAAALASMGRFREAIEWERRAAAIHLKRMARGADERSLGPSAERRAAATVFRNQVFLMWQLVATGAADRDALIAEAFEAGQRAQALETGRAVSGMAVRTAARDPLVAHYIRERQDLLGRWQLLDRRQTALAGLREREDAARAVQAEIDAVSARLDEVDRLIAVESPGYAELIQQLPLPLTETQALLAADEALVSYLLDEGEGYAWVVRRDRVGFHRIALSMDQARGEVARLRADLDLSRLGVGDDLRFDLAAAHALYRRVFAPLLSDLGEARHIIFVSDGGLASLPFGVLVSDDPAGLGHTRLREARWLVERYAMSVLPSVDSLGSLRRLAPPSAGRRPFIGVGDPLLDGKPGASRGRDVRGLYRGDGVADVQEVRQMLRLPETAEELAKIADLLGADGDSLWLGEHATERHVRTADLSDVRVIAFATHAITAGEFSSVSEPSLVLTPPPSGTPDDDGLLAASEVAELKLDADMVILSACNTAADDGTPNAEGLSGLARAFFHAGSRSVLVSHWPVESNASVRLTTRMIRELVDHPEIGRAEALRRSMLALMADGANRLHAHPAIWGPFILVGEGGVRAAGP
jgi:CHAT domain-containing protein/tetratricopeptide (TPR) repeat protein